MRRESAVFGFLWLALVLPDAAAASSHPEELIVAFRPDGPHALRESAESIFARGRSFSGAAADASDSLDRIHRRIAPRSVRALLPDRDGRSSSLQRSASRQRAQHLFEALTHVYRIELGPGASPAEALALYASDPHVAWVQRNHPNELDALPNDPYLASSGSWGQAFEDLWALYRIRAPEAWEISRGEGVVVAVVDTGLDYDHPDIAANVWVNPGEDLDRNGVVDGSDWNGLDDDQNGFIDDLRGWDFANSIDENGDGDFDDPGDVSDPDPFDDRGHGTHVSGTIAAVGDNGIGIVGVAPAARIMPLKGFKAEGPGRDSDLWRAVLYAIENGASVVNTSFSCDPMCPSNPLAESVVAIAHELDVVIVASAGNRLSDVVFNSPQNLRETITVASSGHDDLPSSSFTNMGWIVDVAAPGGDPSTSSVRVARRNILSLRSSADLSALPFTVGEQYFRNAGTSMAAPHVSGGVALLRSARPELGYEEIRRLIREGSVDTGPPGHDRRMGAGRLDAFASLTGELADLGAALTAPRQGSVFAPRGGAVVEIRGSADGADLSHWQLSYGLGNEPASWVPIEGAGPDTSAVSDGVLARWSIDGLVEGTYVVKLEVTGREGSLYSEFLELSLERNAFFPVSSAGPPAFAPDVSGSRVLWQSMRDPHDPTQSGNDFDLFLTDLASKRERDRVSVIAAGPGDQHEGTIDGSVIGWIDTGFENDHSEVFTCRLDRHFDRNGRCVPLAGAPGTLVSLPPAAAGDRLYWLDASTGVVDIHGCTPLAGRKRRPGHEAGTCPSLDVGLDPSSRIFLRSDGNTLTWHEANSRIALCDVDPRTGACPRRSLAEPVFAVSQVTASRGLVAWVEFSPRDRNPLMICELDPATGDCPPVEIIEQVGDPMPELSGNRLVWVAELGSEESDVFFCEYDRVLGQCPVQRVTAHMAPERAAVIDEQRVVWETDRDGATAIEGIELPALVSLSDRRVAAGSRLFVLVRSAGEAIGRHAASLRLDAEAVGDQALEELGARFVDGGRGLGALVWETRRDQVGSWAITFSGTSDAGLVTRQTIRIAVEEPGRRPSPRR